VADEQLLGGAARIPPRAGLASSSGGYLDRLPKGQRVHSVPMAPQVAELLRRLAPADRDPDARVFPGTLGGAMDASALYLRYIRTIQRAGIRRLRLHDLRHTLGTQAIASGAHVMDVKDWMDHRHLSTTMRYVHYRTNVARAMDRDPCPDRDAICAACACPRATPRGCTSHPGTSAVGWTSPRPGT